MYSLDIYDKEFYIQNLSEGEAHAKWFPDLIIKLFNPKSIADIGCARGHFIKVFKEKGIECLGIEGSKYAVESSLCPNEIILHDLRIPLLKYLGIVKYDVAISIEISEHIDPEYADIYIDNLCKTSDTIIITAAPPGQGGTAHVNEQPKEYWIKKFVKRGYEYDLLKTTDFIYGALEAKKDGEFVTDWMIKNIMVFKK